MEKTIDAGRHLMAVLFSALVLGLMFPLQGHAQGGPRTLSVSFKDKPLYEILDYISKHGDSRITRSEEHTSELQSRQYLVCRLLLEKKKKYHSNNLLIKY